MKRCLLLLVDGLRPDVLEEEFARGNLPALGELTASGGRGRAITSFPSTTSVAYLPFLTGCTPGRCNIPSIRWLDRTRYRGRWWRDRGAVRSYCGYQSDLLDGDISPQVATLFQLVPESLAIFTPVGRGLAPGRDPARLERKLWGAAAHYLQWHQPSDNAVSRHLLRELDRPWRFIFAQFPAVDGYTHQQHPRGPGVLRALRRVDRTIALVRERLAQREELEDTLIAVVSDHGASPMMIHLDLADWFRAQGVPTLSHPVLWERDPRAAVMVAGNASAMVYARPGTRRDARWPVERLRRPETFDSSHDLVEALVNQPGVAFVAGESERGGLLVVNRRGEAQLEHTGDGIRYTPHSADPLELGGAAVRSAREWLAASWDGQWPDAAWQLLDQFRAPRTGDLVVVAEEGFDFRKRYEVPEHRSGHGSLCRSHMQTPLWSSHPLPEETLRTVDIFPALCHWLGVAVPEHIDGEPVWMPGNQRIPAVT